MNEAEKNSLSKAQIKPFEATPYAVGNSHVVTIPSYNIKAGVVSPGKKYRIIMEEITQEQEKEVESHEE